MNPAWAILTALLLWPLTGARAAPLFGPEFELTNGAIFISGMETGMRPDTPAAVSAQQNLLAEYTKHCLPIEDCRVEKLINAHGNETYRVHFDRESFWLQISTDPATVEVQAKPSTAAELARAKPRIDALFAAGKQAGIRPTRRGSGHIHIGIQSAFGRDAKLFRNFLVDMVNHQELAGGGVLGADAQNAPHLSLLGADQKQAFRQVIREFDEGKMSTIEELATAINRRVYDGTPVGWNPPDKYQALNLTNAEKPGEKATVELRGIGAQRSADEFLREVELFSKRIEFLKTRKEPIPLLEMKEIPWSRQLSLFRSYVEESGLKWEDYHSLIRANLPRNYRKVVAVSALPTADPSRRPAKGCARWFHLLGLDIKRLP